MLSAEKPAIVLTREGHFDEVMYYDKCGYDAKHYECVAASAADGKLTMKFENLSGNREYVNYEIPMAPKDTWEKTAVKRNSRKKQIIRAPGESASSSFGADVVSLSFTKDNYERYPFILLSAFFRAG